MVNGESGAGKTEACRQLMRYIADASARTRGAASSHADGASVGATLERDMMHASRVLEAFGNAHTICNRNSSRFGKLCTLRADDDGTLCGSAISGTWFLLADVPLRHCSSADYYSLL